MVDSWIEKWKRVTDKETAEEVLKYIAQPSYVPTTSAKLAINELGMGGPLHSEYTNVRDQLTELGFILYEWGEPVRLSPEFREFVDLQGNKWIKVIKGESEEKPVLPSLPDEVEAKRLTRPAVGPTEVEDDALWDRFDKQIRPMLESEISLTGEVLLIRTARQGRRSTGGRFSRPDLTYLQVGRYPLLGEKYVNVVSVEVKTWATADDVGNAYEAVAYTRFSTQVYYAYECPSEHSHVSGDVSDILTESGIGIIRIWREDDHDKSFVDASPKRLDPSQLKIEGYLENLRDIDTKGIEKLLHSKYR